MPAIELSRQTNGSRLQRDAAGDGGEHRRLAGAVRSDDADDLAFADIERDATQRDKPAITDVDVFDFEHR